MAAELLAEVSDLEERAGEAIEKPEDIALARRLLRKASNQARLYGKPGWTPADVPDVVVDIVIEAAYRGYENPAGYELERADMLTLNRGALALAGCNLTADEKKDCGMAAGRIGGGYWSVAVERLDTMTDQVISTGGGLGGGE